MNADQIKDFCEEALSITDQYGVEDGLSFLIGEKFCQELHKLKKSQNKLKYLCPRKADDLLPNDRILNLSHVLTVDENYREHLEKVRHQEHVVRVFMHEIKEYFDINDIKDYLHAYPRLGYKQKSSLHESLDHELESPFTPDDILEEVNDILIVQELTQLFQ